MPEIPNIHAGVMMALTGLALFLFSRDRIPLATSSLAVLGMIVVFFELFPFAAGGEAVSSQVFFSGFGHKALIAVAALMVCGQGLVSTGALVPVAHGISRLWKSAPRTTLLLTLVAGMVGSAFVNNTPIVILLIPILARVAHKMGTSAAPWLMPMNFSTLLGGTSTTIGTSTNLLVVAVAADLGLRQFGMFDFVVPAGIAGGIGILYLWLIAPLLLNRPDKNIAQVTGREFIYQLEFLAESASVGKTIGELNSSLGGLLTILRVRRKGQKANIAGAAPLPDIDIKPEDRLTCRGTADQAKEAEHLLGAQIVGTSEDDNFDEDIELAQIVVMEGSNLVGRSVDSTRFPARYDVTVLAIHRAARGIHSLPAGVGDVTIQTGDVLLVQASVENIESIKADKSLLVLDERRSLPQQGRGWIAVSILIGVVATTAADIMPIETSAVVGCLLMLITRCIDWSDVTIALSIPVIMIIVVSLAMGSALTITGATKYLAEVFLYLMADASPTMILSALMLMMAIFTNVVSNNAAAVIGTPIAISVAQDLGAPPEIFVLAVLFGANLSFVTPMAYKTNVLVMSAGDYSFGEFVKVGLPLAILLWLSYSYILPKIYGL
ncbi:MAG: SLC13 family permease [Gammaproteobacteria bacterium]|nr:SLC13 family permease [Gammaproteobacteria bacterium]